MRQYQFMTVDRIKAHTETRELGAIRLYREDLEDIARAVGELGPLEIVFDETFAATGPEDFAKLPESPTSITFRASHEDQKVEVYLAHSNRITLKNPDTLCHGIASRVQEVCARPGRRRFPLRVKTAAIIGTAVLGVIINVVLVALAVSGVVKMGLMTNSVTIATAAPPLAGSIYLMRLTRSGRFNTHLINAYRQDRPSFWRRTKDDWAVEAVVGAIFLVIGFVLGKISE